VGNGKAVNLPVLCRDGLLGRVVFEVLVDMKACTICGRHAFLYRGFNGLRFCKKCRTAIGPAWNLTAASFLFRVKQSGLAGMQKNRLRPLAGRPSCRKA